MQFPTFETARLRLRPFRPGDWQALHAYARDPAAMAFVPPGALSAEQARAFAERHSGAEAEAAAVELVADQRLIGHLIFHPWFAPRTFEIGWAFDPRHHGRGYASEAARALVAYGFGTLGLHRIIATCQPENPASYRVMEKIGMRREGHFRQCIARDDGSWWDELFYAILREEWQASV